MPSVRKIFVECVRDGQIIDTYEFGLPETAGLPPPPPSDQHLIAQAKSNLTTLRKAFPPYEGIKFKVRRARDC